MATANIGVPPDHNSQEVTMDIAHQVVRLKMVSITIKIPNLILVPVLFFLLKI